jgi:hypothetical protein
VNYIEELQKKIKELETSQMERPPREPHSSPMDISEPEVVLASDPTGASTSSTMDVSTTSPTPEEELPEEELLENLEEELLAIPDFNSMEDFTKWLEQ